jgi:hypothetical protein
MPQAPFVIQPRLTAITLAYRNLLLIADQVLPRMPVDSESFKWSQYTKEDGYTIPDTKVGRKSSVNEIDWSGTEQTASTQDYGLEDLIPYFDVRAAEAAMATQGVKPIDPEARSTQLLSDLIALDRENRVATLVFGSGNYPAANKATLSGTSQWSDRTNSDPINAILAAMDAMIVRPNTAVFGRATWTQLRQHPKVVAAVFTMGGNAAAGGVASRQAVADLLEVNQLIIGEAYVNTAKKGQTGSFSRLWGKHAAFLYLDPAVQGPDGGLTFGFTAQWGQRIAGTVMNDSSVGLRGGTRVRVGEAVKEVIAASDTGYLFTNAVA